MLLGGKNRKQEVIFSSQEEHGFVEYFQRLSEREVGLNSLEVRNIIKCWLDQENRIVSRFKDNMPTSNWVTQFKRRHPTLFIKPIKTIKPVKIKLETRQESDGFTEKVSPDSTQGSIMNESTLLSQSSSHDNVLSEVDDKTMIVRPISPLVINHELSCSSTSNEVPYRICQSSSSMCALKCKTPTDVPKSSKKRRYSGDGHDDNHPPQELHFPPSPRKMNCSRSPSPMNCESPPIIVHPSDASHEKSVYESTVITSGINRNNNLFTPQKTPINKSRSSFNSLTAIYDSKHSASSIQQSQSKNFIALKALEETLSDEEKDMFYQRFEESSSLELDLLYIAWKVLKQRCVNDENTPTMANYHSRNDDQVSSSVPKKYEEGTGPVADEAMEELNEVINRHRYNSAYDDYPKKYEHRYDYDSATHFDRHKSPPPEYVTPNYENEDVKSSIKVELT